MDIHKCQKCSREFSVDESDESFYQKMGVAVPVLCPDCRFKRRGVWRNEMLLYSIKCALCGKSAISMFKPGAPYTVYCRDCYSSDKWDPLSYGRAYDPARPFFEQLGELLRAVPKPATFASADIGPNVNSDYTNFTGSNKDCYLMFNSGPHNENCAYGRGLSECRDAFDVYYADALDRAYEGVNIHKSAGVVWGQNISDALDSAYVLNCNAVQHCFGCVNLRHKSYYFLNEPLAKDEYEKRVSAIRGSYRATEEFRKTFEGFSLKFPRRENSNLKNSNVSGDYIFESKDCINCFEVSHSENLRYSFSAKNAKDCYDIMGHGRRAELLLDDVATGSSSRVMGSWWVTTSHDVEYSTIARDSAYCFGCDGVRGGEHLILNKQYSEGEYKELRAKIIDELKSKNLYGLYMPPELAFFAYNETVAQDNMPLMKEAAIAEGFRWEDELQLTRGKETMKPEAIPDHIKDVQDSILSEVLACVTCGRNYKIIPAELAFYRAAVIPIPRKCFQCRHADRICRRGPMKLYDRTCAKCGKGIRTSYAPERPEIVYCEACYNAEVV